MNKIEDGRRIIAELMGEEFLEKKLASRNSFNDVVQDYAVAVDREARTVALASGSVMPYDKLVISPGIDFKDGSVPGWDVSRQNLMPHAYKAGSQTQLLKAQIAANGHRLGEKGGTAGGCEALRDVGTRRRPSAGAGAVGWRCGGALSRVVRGSHQSDRGRPVSPR